VQREAAVGGDECLVKSATDDVDVNNSVKARARWVVDKQAQLSKAGAPMSAAYRSGTYGDDHQYDILSLRGSSVSATTIVDADQTNVIAFAPHHAGAEHRHPRRCGYIRYKNGRSLLSRLPERSLHIAHNPSVMPWTPFHVR
jgi:hypothetical protein